MRIYLRTASNNKSSIEKIKSTLKRENHSVEVSTIEVKDKDAYTSKDTDILLKYDLIVVEASTPNAQLGFEAAFALEKNIPTVILYNDETGNNSLFPLMSLNPKAKLIMKGYKVAELEKDVEKISKEIEDFINNRFTMSLTPQISQFLNWIVKQKKITRSDYVRNLIETALKKNTDYKKFLKG